MIPAFIMWLLKKYLLHAKKNTTSHTTGASSLKKRTKLLIMAMFFAVPSMSQQQTYHYNVLYKGNNVGTMHLTQMQTGDELSVRILSYIEMNMLMSIKVNVTEEATYTHDKLMYSSVYREVNGKQKANRQTKYSGNNYQIIKEGKTDSLNDTFIQYNLVRLYCKEPENITQVYSDNFQQFLDIKAIGAHKYKLELPDGNYNVYYFQNGICNKVDVHSSFYTVQIQLAQNSIF